MFSGRITFGFIPPITICSHKRESGLVHGPLEEADGFQLGAEFLELFRGGVALRQAGGTHAQPFNTRKTDNNAQGNDIIIAIINA